MMGPIATAAFAFMGVGALAVTTTWQPMPRLMWNASASVPIGLYAVQSPGTLTVGELVVVRPPEALAFVLAEGRHLPRGVPLLKHVGAIPGQSVCRDGTAVSVEGTVQAQAQLRDHAGHLLPTWSGCLKLAESEVFLLNPAEPTSLDGRYFGPLPASSVIGRAVPLWIEGAY